jgi:hypothetical protein
MERYSATRTTKSFKMKVVLLSLGMIMGLAYEVLAQAGPATPPVAGPAVPPAVGPASPPAAGSAAPIAGAPAAQ